MDYTISTDKLTKIFDKTMVVDHITFNVREGAVFGLLGPNDAGKTTTIRLLTTVFKPDEGTAKILGYDLLSEPLKIRAEIGVLPEEAGVYDRLTSEEMLIFHGKIRKMKDDEILVRIDRFLSILGLQENRDQKIGKFSKGMKQKLALIRALFHDPQILFLDEPTTGLDVMSAREIRKLIVDESKRGKTVVLSTHNMWEAQQICSEVAIINKGRIASQGSIETLEDMTHEKNVCYIFKVRLVKNNLKLPC